MNFLLNVFFKKDFVDLHILKLCVLRKKLKKDLCITMLIVTKTVSNTNVFKIVNIFGFSMLNSLEVTHQGILRKVGFVRVETNSFLKDNKRDFSSEMFWDEKFINIHSKVTTSVWTCVVYYDLLKLITFNHYWTHLMRLSWGLNNKKRKLHL